MRRITLSNTSKKALIDDKCYVIVSKYKWSMTCKGYAHTTIKNKTVRMHRLIMKAPKKLQVDHINKNTLDNRLSNLRLCTPSQNSANSKVRKDSTSGYKGVSWHKTHKMFRARIGKEATPLGNFTDPIMAAKAYDKAARKRYGEFACLNFPNDK